MKMVWTRIWITGATVLIAIVTVVLIIALHVAKLWQRLFSLVSSKQRTEHHAGTA